MLETNLAPAPAGEEMARARIYRLLARLFQAPPDAGLLEAIAEGRDVDTATGPLADRWLALVDVAGRTHAEEVRNEHRMLLLGRWKSRAQRVEALCRTMSSGIALRHESLEAQSRYLCSAAPAVQRTCSAMASRHGAPFYRALARFTAEFLGIELRAFRFLPTTGVHSHDPSQAPF
jgi:TorA maturation chaperone TorD